MNDEFINDVFRKFNQDEEDEVSSNDYLIIGKNV